MQRFVGLLALAFGLLEVFVLLGIVYLNYNTNPVPLTPSYFFFLVFGLINTVVGLGIFLFHRNWAGYARITLILNILYLVGLFALTIWVASGWRSG